MPLEAVLLDVGGVLVVADEARLYDGMVAAGFARPEVEMVEAHYRVTAEIDLLTHAPSWEADAAAFAQLWAAQLGVGSDDDAIAALDAVFTANQPLWEQVLPWAHDGLAGLIDAGLRVGIISNADGTVEDSLRRAAVCQVGDGDGLPVEVIVDSTVVGVEKPDPAIFAVALEAMGLAPEVCAYVGDTVRYDVDGARAAGLHPVHLDPYGLCRIPDHHDHVASLVEVPALLGVRR
ncbi:MAG: HAD family hydrolase [Acidimicrobiales bacterium]